MTPIAAEPTSSDIKLVDISRDFTANPHVPGMVANAALVSTSLVRLSVSCQSRGRLALAQFADGCNALELRSPRLHLADSHL